MYVIGGDFFFTLGVGISRPLQIIYSLWRLLDLWPGALYLMGWGNNCIIAYENSFASIIIDQSIQSAYLRWNNKSCESSILATLQNSHSNNIVTRSRRFYLRKTQCLITSVQMRCTQYEFFSSLEYQEISSNHYFTKKKKITMILCWAMHFMRMYSYSNCSNYVIDTLILSLYDSSYVDKVKWVIGPNKSVISQLAPKHPYFRICLQSSKAQWCTIWKTRKVHCQLINHKKIKRWLIVPVRQSTGLVDMRFA